MNEKLDILQCLIENRVFAPSHSALAKELGYKVGFELWIAFIFLKEICLL